MPHTSLNRVKLVPPGLDDVEEVFEFEVRNRRFFETNINARPAAYYTKEGVLAAIQASMEDARADRGYQFLTRDSSGGIVGRVNLSRVRRAHFHSAELGYRVGESACGKGYGRDSVRQILEIAFRDLALVRIEATSRPENIGSVRILLSAGFREFGRSTRSFQLGDTWYDILHFERRADT